MGIVIGICVVNGADDYVAGLVEGIANGIAAGILIYVSMVEILADEFAHDAVRTNYLLKVHAMRASDCFKYGCRDGSTVAIYSTLHKLLFSL